MLSPDERFLIGLKVLKRLRKELQAEQKSGPAQTGVLLADRESPGDVRLELVGEIPQPIPTLEQLLENTGPLPPSSVILGACEDGLPFVLDLANPAPGSLLFLGSQGAGKTRLLGAILDSLVRLNQTDEAIFNLICDHPGDYARLARDPHCQSVLNSRQEGAVRLVEQMGLVAGARRRGGDLWPAIVLVIDDLPGYVSACDEQAYASLAWLVRHGPRSRVWVLAALDLDGVAEVGEPLLAAFRTRIIGYAEEAGAAHTLFAEKAVPSAEELGKLQKGFQFCVPFGDEWVRFWTCETEDSLSLD